MGDAIQAAKAGILEVADVFCVNKSDKQGASDTARDLRSMLEMGPGRDADWSIPIVMTSATSEEGVDELREAIRSHEAHLREGGRLEARRRARFASEIREIVGERMKAALERVAGADVLEKLTNAVLERKLDPYSAAQQLLDQLLPER
jgi:LAO/AO transport system kinase